MSGVPHTSPRERSVHYLTDSRLSARTIQWKIAGAAVYALLDVADAIRELARSR